MSILFTLNSSGQFQDGFTHAIEDNSFYNENKIKSDSIKMKMPIKSDTFALPNTTLWINNTHNQEFNNLNLTFQYLHILNSSNLIFNNITALNLKIISPLIQIEFSRNIIINNIVVDNLTIGPEVLWMMYTSNSDNIKISNSIMKNVHYLENETIQFEFMKFFHSNAIIINNNLFDGFNFLISPNGKFDPIFYLISMFNVTDTIISNNEITKFNLQEGGKYREAYSTFIGFGGRNVTVLNNLIHSNYIGFRSTNLLHANHLSSHIIIKDNKFYNNTHASITYIQSTMNAISITGNIIQNNQFISKIDIGDQIIRGGRSISFIDLFGVVNETLVPSDRYAVVANNIIRNFGYLANYNQIELYRGDFYEYPLSYTYTVYNNTFDNIYPLDDMGYQGLGIELMTIWNIVSPLVKTMILNNTFSNIIGVDTNNMEGIFLQFVNEFSGNKLINITNFASSIGIVWRGIRNTSGHYSNISNNILTLGSGNPKTIMRLYTYEGNETSKLFVENNVFSHTDGKGRGIYYEFEHDNFIFRLQNNTFEGMDDWLVGSIDGKNIDFNCLGNTVNGVFAIGCFAIANPLGSQSGKTVTYTSLMLIILTMFFVKKYKKRKMKPISVD